MAAGAIVCMIIAADQDRIRRENLKKSEERRKDEIKPKPRKLNANKDGFENEVTWRAR
jgi:hypothetical protein